MPYSIPDGWPPTPTPDPWSPDLSGSIPYMASYHKYPEGQHFVTKGGDAVSWGEALCRLASAVASEREARERGMAHLAAQVGTLEAHVDAQAARVDALGHILDSLMANQTAIGELLVAKGAAGAAFGDGVTTDRGDLADALERIAELERVVDDLADSEPGDGADHAGDADHDGGGR